MRERLHTRLLSQPFAANPDTQTALAQARLIAQLYCHTENSIAVLSDMKAGRSYIYTGLAAAQLELTLQDGIIDSIWEDELLRQIHQDDLARKYELEAQFFKFIAEIPVEERLRYQLSTALRFKSKQGLYQPVKHRLLYLSSTDTGSVWLTLCLYNLCASGADLPQGLVTNTLTGEVIHWDQQRAGLLLSPRQQEILRLIKAGKRSKEIAARLSLSIHTINRHRQDIFAKLNVSSALEACKVSEDLGLPSV